MNRRICIVTGTRAEYGLLYWLMREIAEDKDLTLQIVATAMHLEPAFGHTVDQIRSDGFSVDAECRWILRVMMRRHCARDGTRRHRAG